MALVFEYDHKEDMVEIKAVASPEGGQFTEEGVAQAYLAQAMKYTDTTDENREIIEAFLAQVPSENNQSNNSTEEIHEVKPAAVFLGSKKKYKPVGVKVRPVYAELDEKFRIVRNITGNPLQGMPELDPNPADFKPTGRYTQERKDAMDEVHKGEFLWPEERRVVHDLISKQNEAFAWDDSERGRFREDFFPPVPIPTVEHTPWQHRAIKIPAAQFPEVCKMIQKKVAAGVYEPSNSSYRSPWFCVLKKNGSLRIVHSLEPLNAVTIAHAGVPPATEELAAKFAGRACGGIFDLYVGYDERTLDPKYRDLTTFQTPFGAMRLCTLPMGWTNSVPIFHDDVTTILEPEIPEVTIPYLDDVPVRGPKTRYEDDQGSYETIPENPGIRRFVWEHLQNVNRVLQRMKYCGGTFSGTKSLVCAEEFEVVGHLCTYEGRKPTEDKIGTIMRWEICKNLSDVRAFLGIMGVLRAYIPNYALRAEGLQKLTRGKVPFVWGPEQEKSMAMLKEGVALAQPLRELDYEGQGAIVLAVDTSYIAIGFYIYQEDRDDPKKIYYAKFGSITLNEREARFSQPKRELYGLMRALKHNSAWLFGARKLIVETDAKYIQGMLSNPDLMPNATINRWIDQILLFHFTIRHKAGATFGPDGLSRRPRQPTDPDPVPDSDEEGEEYAGPPDLIHAEPRSPDPLPIEDFADKIDTRGGYILGIARSYKDISKELHEADMDRIAEQAQLKLVLQQEGIAQERVVMVTTLLNALSLPDENSHREESHYPEEHRRPGAVAQDELIPHVERYLRNKHYRPKGMDNKKYKSFKTLANRFVIYEDRLYRRGYQSQHRLYVKKENRMYMLKSAHDHNGHRGFFATRSMLVQRFWWPEMEEDVKWFVKSCGPCQERQLQLLRIPRKVTHTPSIFQVLHADVMHMSPASNGCKYIVHGRCGMSSWAEGRPLRNENAKSIALWLYEDILCRWGSLEWIVTDNGPAFIAAVAWLVEKYGIAHIKISAYNSQANGRIERPHFDIRQILYKTCGEKNVSKWFWFFHAALWADRTSIRKRIGCSPYFLVTGAHPILPIDVKEATWLVKPPIGVLTDDELIAFRARALAKHRVHVEAMRRRIDEEKLKELQKFEEDHKSVIKDYTFEPGDLVLVRNTAIENSLDKKMKPRYMGPMIVVSRRPGGSYIIAEMTGAVFNHKVGAFRVIPYFARQKIAIPEGIQSILDVDASKLAEIDSRPTEEELQDLPADAEIDNRRDYLMDGQNIEEDSESDE